eukprot:Rhum_TRINITY_DN15441_c3_g2::Rhum_TRINITY_DN15441_c3_g2_i10::g.154926::m.154926/K06889/K06889; uncharacterized protein
MPSGLVWRVALAAGACASASAAVCICLVRRGQGHLLYQPGHTDGADTAAADAALLDPAALNASADARAPDAAWAAVAIPVTADTAALGLFLRPACAEARRRACTVLYLHGNAGHVGHRARLGARLHEALRCNVLLLSYRGYRGSSPCPPCEDSMRADACAALRFLAEDGSAGVDPARLFVLGASLGGAVALAAVADPRTAVPVAGVVLENSFTSVPDLVADTVQRVVDEALRSLAPPAQPQPRGLLRRALRACARGALRAARRCWRAAQPLLVSLEWDSLQRVRRVPASVPVLFVSSSRDELVPPAHMRALHAACPSPRKRFAAFAKGRHNTVHAQKGYHAALLGFFAECTSPQRLRVGGGGGGGGGDGLAASMTRVVGGMYAC